MMFILWCTKLNDWGWTRSNDPIDTHTNPRQDFLIYDGSN